PDIGGNVNEISIRLRFVVEKDGSFTDIQVVGADPHGAGREAIRVLRSMPKWKPAQHNGKTVRSSFTLPIKIRVNN
ncbi:MAG TPA: energy transducer TonB, partial [Flavobacteriaceae bacterium]|nr:energy transducer TonB [Flavobacteriaceae bacterium]